MDITNQTSAMNLWLCKHFFVFISRITSPIWVVWNEIFQRRKSHSRKRRSFECHKFYSLSYDTLLFYTVLDSLEIPLKFINSFFHFGIIFRKWNSMQPLQQCVINFYWESCLGMRKMESTNKNLKKSHHLL